MKLKASIFALAAVLGAGAPAVVYASVAGLYRSLRK